MIPSRDDRDRRWWRIETAFTAGHGHPLNLALHAVATSIGTAAALALAAKWSAWLAIAAVGVQIAHAGLLLPAGLLLAQSVVMVALLVAALATNASIVLLSAIVVASWLLQDLAHRSSGEPAYDRDYRGRPGALGRWVEHVLLLVPLVLVSLFRARARLVASLVPRRSVIEARLEGRDELAALALVRRWVEALRPVVGSTTHWWIHEVDPDLREACVRIAESESVSAMFRARHGARARIRPVPGMNEIYVAGPDRETSSDRVFYVPHLDGPFTVFPGATLYRCMVAVSPNRRIRTHFPLDLQDRGTDAVVLDEGQVVAFDYHRTPHYISADEHEPATAPRINLKLHYVVSPPGLGWWADRLAAWSTRYNEAARTLFLDALTPSGRLERALATTIVWQTDAWQWIARHLGHRNLLYVALLGAASLALGSAVPLVAGGSFVHYFLYLATFASREDVSFGTFRRDVVFHKVVSLAILAGLYLFHFELDPVSLALIAAGFGTAALAADALGPERTYFGAELGVCERRRIDRFPYGAIPHPMILGSIVGLLGVGLLAPLDAAWPWLVPTHVALYVVHLVQEMVDEDRDAVGPRIPGAGIDG